MVCRVLADVLDAEIVDHKGEVDIFSGMFPKGRGPSDMGVAKLCKVYLEPIVRDAAGLGGNRGESLGWSAYWTAAP